MTITFGKKSAVKAGFLVSMAMVTLIVVHFVGVSKLTPEAIRNLIHSLGCWGPIIYILLYTIRPLLLFPALILTLAGAIAFGPWWGTLYVVIGGLSGACLCFGIARVLGREKMNKYLGKYAKMQYFNKHADDLGFKSMLIMRVVPIFPYDPVSYLSGLTKISFRDYALATAIGMLPGAIAYNFLGCSLMDVFSIDFLMVAMLVGVVMCTPLLYHYVRNKG